MKPRKHSPPVSYAFDEAEAAARDAIDALDRVALDCEQRWGYVESVTRRLPPEDAARFTRARLRLDEAIEAKAWDRVPALAGAVARGWKHVTGLVDPVNEGDCPTWRTTVEGQRYLIVRDSHDIGQGLPKADGEEIVLSLEELIRLFTARRQERLLEIKRTFPGSHVVEVKIPQPDWAGGDEVPF